MDTVKARNQSATACVALLAAALTSAVAAQAGNTRDTPEDGDEASIAQQCLNHPSLKRTKILNDRNIVFITRDDLIYNNQLPRQCPSLRRNSLVNYTIANSRLCAGDAFQVLWDLGGNNYTPAFLCRLGNFVPITEAEYEDLVALTEPQRGRRSARRSNREAVTTEEVELPAPPPAAEEPANQSPN